MCGIIGYIGEKEAQPILLAGLKRLEYRGYDSAGICMLIKNNKALSLRKLPGKVKDLEWLLKKKPLSGNLGVGHCLAPETLVFLSDGRIKEIAELKDEEGVFSARLDTLQCQDSNKIKVFRHQSPALLYRVQTPYFSFVATGQHRIFAADVYGQIIEKKVQELNGELIALPRRISFLHKHKNCRLEKVFVEKHFLVSAFGRTALQEIRRQKNYTLKKVENLTGIRRNYIRRVETGERASIEEGRMKRLLRYYGLKFNSRMFSRDNFITNDLFLPHSTSDELMQILGYTIGDGHITQRMIRFKESRYDICKLYQGLFKKIFNLSSDLKKNKGHYLFVISSRFLADWFRKNFPTLSLSMVEKDLPEFLGSLPKKQIAGFLRGLFDAEGAVGLRSGQISLGMVSRRVVQKAQLLLLYFGVLATYSEEDRAGKGWNDIYRLSINDKESMENFIKEIGFSSADKQKKVSKLISAQKGRNYKYFALPVRLDKFYYNYLRPSKIHGWRKIGIKPQASYLTNYSLHKIKQHISSNKEIADGGAITELRELLRKFTASDFVWVKARTTKIPSPYEWVYDLEVNPSSNFLGNGILQHNSRWATHGAPNQANAHPHLDCKSEIALVHNGIIENYQQLKQMLARRGHKFRSQTDTEVIAHLIEDFYSGLPFAEAVRKALSKLEGSFAVAVISKREPDKLIGARLGSPLVVGIGKGENFLASDLPALLDVTKEALFLEDGECAVLSKDKVEVSDLSGKPVTRPPVHIDWDIEQAQKQGWPHFMLKEINEQPKVLEGILAQRVVNGKEKIAFEELKIGDEALRAVEKIQIIGCGSAYHAGLCGRYILEKLCRRPACVELASEFRYAEPLLGKGTLVIAISQSGETADTLAAAREARKKGALVLAVCNVLGSTLVRESDGVIYTHAGPEIGVASTKAYTAQLAILYLFALYLANILKVVQPEAGAKLLKGLQECPRLQQKVLEKQALIKKAARRHSHFGSFLFLGRNVNYPSALEGALKLKEVSYIPAEGYAAGEMKHGPIALIDEYRAVVCIAPASRIYEKMSSNIQEIRSRRGKIIAIATEGDEKIKGLSGEVIYTPRIEEFLSPLIMALPLQLLAYHIAVKRGCDVDQPRNLAKSVTVE